MAWGFSLSFQCSCFFPLKRSVTSLAGENVKEFFFRVASLAFETNVLAELEKSGTRQIGDVVSEYPNTLWTQKATFFSVTYRQNYRQLCAFFRNQQHFKQSVHGIKEETAQLLSVRMKAGILKWKAQTQNEAFLRGRSPWLLSSWVGRISAAAGGAV